MEMDRRNFMQSLAATAGLGLAAPGDLARLVLPGTLQTVPATIGSRFPADSRLVTPQRTRPPDLIPKEVLESEYHTRIHDLSDQVNSVTFGFREGELREQDSMLRMLQERDEPLDIFILNGHVLNSAFLTESQKLAAPEAENILSTCVHDYANAEMGKVITNRVHYRTEYELLFQACDIKKALGIYSPVQCEVEKSIAFLNYEKYLVPEPSSDLLLLASYGIYKTIDEKSTIDNSISRKHHYVFVIGRDPDLKKFGDDSYNAVYNPFNYRLSERMDGRLQATLENIQSHPNIESLTRDYAREDYIIIAGLRLYDFLEHEFGHVKGYNHPRNDQEILARRRRARQLYESTGDDSGYWIYLESPTAQVRS
jgi:hypothetical protein